MVRLQRLVGCRPGEICRLRPCDTDRSDAVWVYRPFQHKTKHRGHNRLIFIGPQAQEILGPYMLRDPDAYCFAPAESERNRLKQKHAARKTPLSCGNRPGSNRVRKRIRPVGQRYSASAYARAVLRACDLADRAAHKAAPSIAVEDRVVDRWSPNQLRHAAATEIRRRFGLEAAQVVLGHSRADVTQVYAERDNGLAAKIMSEVG
jgi:integrase